MTAASTSGGAPAGAPSTIVCVGRNYADHAAEMGAERPSEPLLFLKPPRALRSAEEGVLLPSWSEEVHHEVELVVRIGAPLRDASEAEAAAALEAVAVGLDLTARDVQSAAKKRGEPWAVAKGFDASAPIGPLVPVAGAESFAKETLELRIDGELRQSGRIADMLWSVPELLARISARFSLVPGDLVFTGTPSGVGPLAVGQQLEGRLGELAHFRSRVLG